MPKFRLLTACLLFSLPLTCLGAEIQLGAGLQNVNVHEVDANKQTLDTESGNLPFLMANFKFNLMSGWSLINENQLSVGNISYDGQLQNGTPYQTTTESLFHTHNLSIETPAIFKQLGGQQRISTSFGYHFWQRHILGKNNIKSLNEEYSWKTIGLGISHTNHSKSMMLKISVHQAFDSKMDIKVTDLGSGTLTLPNGVEYRVNGEYQLSKNKSFRTQLGFRYSYLLVPRSNPSNLYKNNIKVATAVEPKHSLQAITAYFAVEF